MLFVDNLGNGKQHVETRVFTLKLKKKNLLASLAHSHRAPCAQLASLARMSAPRARDLMVVALRV